MISLIAIVNSVLYKVLPPGIYFIFGLAVSVFCYSFFIGTVLARLWYYKGRVHGDFQVFDIQPAYKRDRALNRQYGVVGAEGELAGRDEPLGKWTAVARPMLDEDDVDDPELKTQIMEDKRISRLPAFLQDDCGDASQFPSVKEAVPAEEYNQQFQASKPMDYRDLGIWREVQSNWLTVDRNFPKHMEAKHKLLDERLDDCVQRMPAVKEASEEMLPMLVRCLTEEYPRTFSERQVRGFPHIKNHNTNVEWNLRRPYEPQALELAARLAVEDFVFFGRDSFTGAWKLIGGSVCFPSGWSLPSIIGQDIDNLLRPVISWDNLSTILDYIDDSNEDSLWKRIHTFIQTNPGRTLPQLLSIETPGDFFQGRLSSLNPEDIVVRKENQIFMRLPQSGVIVMTVKTELVDLMEMGPTERQVLAKEIHSWEPGIARAKGLDLWRRIVLGFIEGKTMMYDDQTVVSTW
ncbi:hypothetical protein P280DRAFT_548646 [Massarina eburnea CBS 473.64]|uniref:HRQ family protein n=1 Tax=Massarina eburnea CBS 473.64 TaxID=1395130 RepID=A0A6A6S450_9PLEO|nr:hypothetical protein P280DRAFT_548646 [Massarina eburnea CBS 473.64]